MGEDFAGSRDRKWSPTIWKKPGLTPYLEKLKFHLVGYGCTTCIGNSGPLPTEVSQAIDEKDLVVASVLSGNRNFEGRINSEVRANYLMSPPLVVAFALAGRIDIDLRKDSLGKGKDGKPVYLADIWPSQREVEQAVARSISSAMFVKSYSQVFQGDERWRGLAVPNGETYTWETDSTYIRRAPYFEGMALKPSPVEDIQGARVLAVLGDSVTTDHISPAGSIKKDGPAGKYLAGARRQAGGLQLLRLAPRQSRSHGARHVRQRAPAQQAGEHRRRIHPAPARRRGNVDLRRLEKYLAEGTPLVILAGKEYGSGSSRDWAAKGPLPAGRARRDRRELRTHSPLEPGRHGLTAVGVWGASDFLGGVGARRANAFLFTAIVHISGMVAATAVALATHAAFPGNASLMWSLAAGAVGGIALAIFYRSLAQGNMGLIAPVAAVLGAAIPTIVTAFSEGVPGYRHVLGFLLAGIGVWLISRTETGASHPRAWAWLCWLESALPVFIFAFTAPAMPTPYGSPLVRGPLPC